MEVRDTKNQKFPQKFFPILLLEVKGSSVVWGRFGGFKQGPSVPGKERFPFGCGVGRVIKPFQIQRMWAGF